MARAAFNFVTAPVRWTWRVVNNYVVNPIATRVANAYRGSRVEGALQGAQQRVWYSPANALVQARTSLIALRSSFATSLNDGNRATLLGLLHNANTDLAAMIAELTGPQAAHYGIAGPRLGELAALQAELNRMELFIQGNGAAAEIPFTPALSKTDFLRRFATALEIADQWGQGSGVMTALKKRVVRPIMNAIAQRPTVEMKECDRLIRVLANPPGDLPPESPREMAVQLVHMIDVVVHQRCIRNDGFIGYEIVQMTPLLLLQADIEDALSHHAGAADLALLIPDLRGRLQNANANRFITQQAQKGYRPRLTQAETDPRIEAARLALVNFRQAPQLVVIPDLLRNIDALLLTYPDRGEQALIALPDARVDGEQALVPLRQARDILEGIRRAGRLVPLNPRSIEILRAAEERLSSISNFDLGWMRRPSGTMTYDPTYTPPVQLVDAFHSLRRVSIIASNGAIGNDVLALNSTNAARELQHFLTWLREPAQEGLYTGYFRITIEELAAHLANAATQPDARTFLRDNQPQLLRFVRDRMGFWSLPARFGGATLPSINSPALLILNAVRETGIALRDAFLIPQDDQVAVPAQNFLGALVNLEQEINWGLIEIAPEPRRNLLARIEAYRLAIQDGTWHQQLATRELALRRFQELEGNVVDVLRLTSSVGNTQVALQPPRPMGVRDVVSTFFTSIWDPGVVPVPRNWSPHRAPFTPEFLALLNRLGSLDQAISKGNADQILSTVRSSWSLSRAMLEQDAGDTDRLAARYHLTPDMIHSLTDLCRMMEKAIFNRERGSCDPASPNYYFQHRLAAAGPGALTTFSSYNAVQESLHFLRFWRENTGPIAFFGTAVQDYVAERLVGRAPQTPPQASPALLHRANELYAASLSSPELRIHARDILGWIRADIQANRLTEEGIAHVVTPLRRLVYAPSGGAAPAIPDATTALALYMSRRLDFHRQDAMTHEERLQLENGGLLGSMLQSGVHKATETLGLSHDSIVGIGLTSGARWVHSVVQDRFHKPVTTTLPPLATPHRLLTASVEDGPGDDDRPPPGGTGRPRGDASRGDGSRPPGGTDRPRSDRTSGRTDGHRTGGHSRREEHATGPAGSGMLPRLGAALEGCLQLFGKVQRDGLSSLPSAAMQYGSTALQYGATKTADLLRDYRRGLNPRTDGTKIARLREVEAAIRTAGTGSAIDTAKSAVSQAMDYLGIAPGSGDDISDPYFLDIDRKVDEALNFNRRKTPVQRPVQELFDEEKKAFVQNNGSFLPMKLLYEYVCGNKEKDLDFYAEMMQRAKAAGPSKEDAVLKEAFMESLEKAGVNWILRKITSWFLYPISMSFAKHYFTKFSDRGVDFVREFIAKNNKDTSSDFANRAVDRTNGFLANLQSAYRRIATKPTISGTVDEELKKELSRPDVNNDMTEEQLYQEASSKFYDQFIAPDLCQWGPATWKNLTTFHYAKGEWHDTVVNGLLHVVAIIATPFAWLLSFPASWVTSYVAKRYAVNGPLLSTLVNQSVGAIEHNGYTHALNSVIYEQLREVLITLRHHFGKTGPEEAVGKSKDPALDLKNMSLVDREKLRTLVQEAFSAIKLHKCKSPEQLRKLVNNDSMLGKAQDELEDKFIYSQVTESIMELLGAAFHTLLKKDQLETQFYQLMSTINGVYKKNQPIPKEEFQAKEEGINKLMDAILLLVIDNVVDEKLDVDKSREKKVADGFMKEMESLAHGLRKTLRKHYEELRHKAHGHHSLPTTTDAQMPLNILLQRTQSAVHKLIDLRTRIEQCSELSSGKQQLLAHLKKMHKELVTVVEPLTALKNPHARKLLGAKMKESIKRFDERIASIQGLLRDPASSDIHEAEEELVELKSILRRFTDEPALSDPSFALETEVQNLETSIKEIGKRTQLTTELEGALSTSRGSLFNWARTILTSSASSTEAKANYSEVQAALGRLAALPDQQQKLRDAIEALRRVSSEKEKAEAARKLMALRTEMLRTTAHANHKAQRDIAALRIRCQANLNKCRFDKVAPAPTDAIDQIGQGLGRFEKWAKEPHPVKLSPLSVPFVPPAMLKMAVDKGSGYVKRALVGIVRKKVDGLLDLIRDRNIWRYGLYHHNILKPFVEGK